MDCGRRCRFEPSENGDVINKSLYFFLFFKKKLFFFLLFVIFVGEKSHFSDIIN